MLELYIFNKESATKDGLANWDNEASDLVTNTLSFNLDRFKFKDSSQHILSELAQELNSLYKETDVLRSFFERLSSSSIEVEMVDNYHHLLCYDYEREVLILDSKIRIQLAPLYLWAIYYVLSRKTQSEDEIYSEMFEFFMSFNHRAIDALIKYIERDQNGPKTYDAGGHLLNYMYKVYQVILDKQESLSYSHDEAFLATQILRNRALVGCLPFDVRAFEEIESRYRGDAFSAEACQEYFEAYKLSFDHEFAKKYYDQLVRTLKIIGLGVVAQRGSRVAHEQGPILINSGSLKISDEFEIKIRKVRSSTIEAVSKLEEAASKFLEIRNLFSKNLLNINLNLDNLLYLCSLKTNNASLRLCPRARFDKAVLEFKANIEDYIHLLMKKAREFKSTKEIYVPFYDLVRIHERQLLNIVLDLEDLVNSTPELKQNAVIYVQRPSSRSGHFIPRILMGHNLYIETDAESEKHRLNAIPYNFVCPEFDYIAGGIDSFFENASISIVTDHKTGKPNIKWENAEDLAISLAPGMYQAIRAAQLQGKRFHYQLETTLFGPLIEIFLAILENEISNVASIAEATGDQRPALKNIDDPAWGLQMMLGLSKDSGVDKLLRSYKAEIMEAAEFCFKYYLLEDEVQNYMLQEKLDRETASFEMILNLRDVQKDIAKYCLLKRLSSAEIEKFLSWAAGILNDTALSAKARAEAISQELDKHITNSAAKIFVKKYIRYPESTARKEFLATSPQIDRVVVTSNKSISDADYYFDLTVAPSRIDFGKHVVASITTLMGRMLGANDPDALIKGKEYIDYVSRTQNSLFETAAEAGSVKVIENTCRAIQYSKAIAFQGVFQSFAIDGALARSTINSRNTKAAGIHIMEYGTMASTGYCITKEPLFILLGLAINSDSLLDQLGVETDAARAELKNLMQELLASKNNFISSLDWQLHIYEELSESKTIQKYLANPDYKWLPNLRSMIALFKYAADGSEDDAMSKAYSSLASKLIEYSRIINETGIIQRIQLMNSAIRRAKLKLNTDKPYKDIRIILNASYKGNVSDERENANQYLMALLLHQRQYLKNVSMPEVEALVDYQIKNYSLPREIRIFDPLVDPEVFMGGELKARAESTIQKLMTLKLSTPLTKEVIDACVITYGSNMADWRILNKRLAELNSSDRASIESELAKLAPDIKYLETYTKGFLKDPLIAFQGIDVIQLNSDHDELIHSLEDLVKLRNLMRVGNADSLLVLVDNPQQAKRPFLDYDKALEWMSLGGSIASHLIAEDVYEKWRANIDKSSAWAKLFIQKLIYREKLSPAEQNEHQGYQDINNEVQSIFNQMKLRADLDRDLIIQKFHEAQEMGASAKSLKRYSEWIQALSRIGSYSNTSEVTFNDWLILGGRWVINGQDRSAINFIVDLFEKSYELRSLGKRGFELMDLFIAADEPLELEAKVRILENAGSTKEADLLVSSAADSLEYRAQMSKASHGILVRMQEYETLVVPSSIEEIEKVWDRLMIDYIDKLKSKSPSINDLNILLGRLFKVLETLATKLSNLDPELSLAVKNFIKIREADNLSLIEIFGDHKKHGGIFQRLAAKAEDLAPVSKLGEMFIDCYLIMLTIGVEDENEIINKLAIFFDQYLNVHEEDYPPYMFHSLCAGSSYGFNQTYYLEPNLRTKMFKLACKGGIHTYKILHYLLSHKSVLKYSVQEYRDSIIGDYDNGMIAIGYQHEGICIEERFWDCMRALRNFVRNYHDKHPLPIILKSQNATVTKLFRYGMEDDIQLVWIAGLSNIGKHSWDLNCVLRSPLLRDMPQIDSESGVRYINVSIFTPYLTNEGEIKQIYTSFRPELVEKQKLRYIAPFSVDFRHPLYADKQYSGHNGAYILNAEGFVHALVNLDPELKASNKLTLPKPNIIMSAHTHPQYINGFTAELKIPEVWSMLSMEQMYSKTELPKILNEIHMESLMQIEFYQKEFESKESLAKGFEKRIEAKNCSHIDYWLLKASKDSGGRGISGKMSLANDKEEMIDFIFNKTRTDDLVMQEFVPNNARAFINPEFVKKVEDAFVDSGIKIDKTTPYEQIFFAMRSFQSMSGIKGYLFSANVGSVTVNAGQGAKMFYGEPIYIMPLYLAGKIQKLLDEQGELILKEAIPRHALKFAHEHDIQIIQNNIGTNNCYMLNGLFDYIPYIYVVRDNNKFKVVCEDNSYGGLDYYYSYYGEKIILASARSHKESLDAIEKVLKDSTNGEYQGVEQLIDIDLAKIEFNSGLGQANLLQRTIEEMAPQSKDLFLEWTEDLGALGIKSLIASRK